MIKIKGFAVGIIEANCYIAFDDGNGEREGVVIDPGGDGDLICRKIKENGVKIVAVINTHGHSDHIAANDYVTDFCKAPLLIHKDDAAMLGDAEANLSAFMGVPVVSKAATRYLSDGDEVKFGDCALQVIHTPGHSPGGICLYDAKDKILFSGDTLFFGSIGRTDFPGGSLRTLVGSIKEKLFTLPDDVQVLSGHGPATTIANEKKFNPFLT